MQSGLAKVSRKGWGGGGWGGCGRGVCGGEGRQRGEGSGGEQGLRG